MKNILSVIFLVIISFITICAQEVKTIQGYIIDEKSRQGIPNVKLSSNNGVSSALTDVQGRFSIALKVTDSKDSIYIDHEDYQESVRVLSKRRDRYYFYLDRYIAPLDFHIDEETKELETINVKDKKIKLVDPFLDIPLDSALITSENENKKVLVYINAKWCGQCKLLDKKLFQLDTVITRLREDIISIKVDVDSREGEKIKEEFKIAGFPTFLILDSLKQVNNRNVGIIFDKYDYDDPEGFFNFIDKGIKSDDLVLPSSDEIRVLKLHQKDHEKIRIGLRFGTHLNSLDIENQRAYEVGAFIHLNKRRFAFRPSLSYLSTSLESERISSLLLPIDLGYSFYKGATFTLPSEFRFYLSPFYQYSYSSESIGVNTHNFGMRYGIDYQIGGDSIFGVTLSYQHLFKDYLLSSDSKLKGIHISVYMAIPYLW